MAPRQQSPHFEHSPLRTQGIACYLSFMKKDNRPHKIRDMHGMHDTPEYRTWRNMLTRCYNPKSDRYANYGGRGIRVCERWRNSFRSFYEDMGPKPPGTTLERRNVNADYGPHNPCEWATIAEQARNTTVNRYVEYGGRSMILPDWANETGIQRLTILMRLDRDRWTVGQALGYEPPPPRKPRHVRLIECNNQKMSIVEWAKERHLTSAAITTRLNTLGWSVPQALGFEPPPSRPGNPNSKAAERQRRHRERKRSRLNYCLPRQ